MDGHEKPALLALAPLDAIPGALPPVDSTRWEKWFQPGEDTSKQYEAALKRCKEISKDLQLASFNTKKGNLSIMLHQSASIRTMKPKLFTAQLVRKFVEKEQARLSGDDDSKEPWRKTLLALGYMIDEVVTKIKPVLDLFLPQSLEYAAPYGCLMIIFQGAAAKKVEEDAAFTFLQSLSGDLPIFDFYPIFFPTDEMKRTLAMLFIHILDLLDQLAKHFALGGLDKLCDVLFPRDELALSQLSTNIQDTATKLETLCSAGHTAETRPTRKVESTDSALTEFTTDIQASLSSNAHELHILRQYVEKLENNQKVTDNALACHRISALFEIWDSQVGAIENELQLWQTPRFFTDPRDHWSQNGILACIAKWTELTFNSILWVSSESGSRQSWMTEFSLDLLRVVRFKGQMLTFALCDRPQGVRWTPEILMKQLICQLLHLNPALAIEEPELFNIRAFRRANNFPAVFQLLESVIGRLDSLLIVIDRLDLCRRDPHGTEDQNVAQALSRLTKKFPKTLRTIVTSGGGVKELSPLGISIAIINTRRRPHRRYVNSTPRRDRP